MLFVITNRVLLITVVGEMRIKRKTADFKSALKALKINCFRRAIFAEVYLLMQGYQQIIFNKLL